MSDLDPPSNEQTPDELAPDEELARDAARARALIERRDAFELSPEQLARGKLALDAALDEHDLRSLQDASRRSKKGERGRLRKWLYTPVLPVLAGVCALALAVRFAGEQAELPRSAAVSQRPVPVPARELVLAQTARLEARLARLDARTPVTGTSPTPDAGAAPATKAKKAASAPGAEGPAPSVAIAARADAKETSRASADVSEAEREFNLAMQAYRSQLLASLTEEP